MTVALIALQLEIDATVLASPAAYRAHVEDVAACAVEDAGDAAARLLVVPELAGHLALLALAPPAAHKAKSLGAALAAAAVRRPLEVLRGAAMTRQLAPHHAVLAALAPEAERYWRAIFGPLARRHAAYVVAGSHLRLGAAGDLANASLLFAPDGRCVATTVKVNLVPGVEDGAPGGLGLARGSAAELPVVDTALGALCTLISYDAFAEPYTSLERFVPLAPRLAARGGVHVVANPAANPWPWLGAWPPPSLAGGTTRAPGTRAAQWQREGLPGTLAAAPIARYGVTAHLVGQVLGLAFEGRSEIVERRGADVATLARAAQHERGGHVFAHVPPART